MNESIIRRFAKYHGIDVTAIAMAPTAPWGGIANLASAIYGSCHTEHVAKVIQSVTRIEDAEILLARVESFSAPLLATSQEAKALREFYEFDAARLLVMAGIDPEPWAMVKV